MTTEAPPRPPGGSAPFTPPEAWATVWSTQPKNLSTQMGARRFKRMTYTASKNAQNRVHALAIYFMHYNFVRIHQTLRVTPAMAAGVTDTLWDLADMVRVLEEWEAGRQA